MASSNESSTRYTKLSRPLMVWDGSCGFCRRWIERWQRQTVGRVDYAPYQQVHERFPQIDVAAFREAVHLIYPDGTTYRGAKAVAAALASTGHSGSFLWLYEHLPGAAGASEWAYRFVARNRRLLSRLGL